MRRYFKDDASGNDTINANEGVDDLLDANTVTADKFIDIILEADALTLTSEEKYDELFGSDDLTLMPDFSDDELVLLDEPDHSIRKDFDFDPSGDGETFPYEFSYAIDV